MNTPAPGGTTNILLFGETGNGKSTLGNQILGFDAFSVSSDVKSETKTTMGHRGKGDNKDVFVIDTPGLQDTSGADKEHMIQMVNYIREKKQLNAIIIVFNYQQVRFPYNIQTMLKLFCNIFPMKDAGNHIALIFTKSYSKRGALTNEQKEKKLEKVFPEFKRVIEEASGTKLESKVCGFVDIDPEEGIDDTGKMDLDRILVWASNLDNLNIEKIQTPEPEKKKEVQEFDEMKIDGEYIIKTKVKRERDVFSTLDGTITYGEWKDISKNTEKIINPEIEKYKKSNLVQDDLLKKIHEENEKKMNFLLEQSIALQQQQHKNFLELIASSKKADDEYEKESRKREEELRKKMEEIENSKKLLNNEKEKEKLEKELEEKKEEKNRRIYLQNRLNEIINNARNGTEQKKGECSKDINRFSAGVTKESELIKFADLSEQESVFKCDYKFLKSQEKIIEKTFPGKIIVGWLLKSEHDHENGGSWQRNSDVLGTSSYSFTLRSSNTRGCYWKLSIWIVDKKLPFEAE